MDDNPNIHITRSAAVQTLVWPVKKVTTEVCPSYFLIHTSTVTSEGTRESLLNEFHNRTQIWNLIQARHGRKSKYVQYHVLSNSSASRGSSLTSAVETGGSPSNCGKWNPSAAAPGKCSNTVVVPWCPLPATSAVKSQDIRPCQQRREHLQRGWSGPLKRVCLLLWFSFVFPTLAVRGRQNFLPVLIQDILSSSCPSLCLPKSPFVPCYYYNSTGKKKKTDKSRHLSITCKAQVRTNRSQFESVSSDQLRCPKPFVVTTICFWI